MWAKLSKVRSAGAILSTADPFLRGPTVSIPTPVKSSILSAAMAFCSLPRPRHGHASVQQSDPGDSPRHPSKCMPNGCPKSTLSLPTG